MIKKTCAATGCDKEFVVLMPHALYCSDKCRWRAHKQKVYDQRKSQNLCPQCGGEMDREISYCSNCKDYFSNRYKVNAEKERL